MAWSKRLVEHQPRNAKEVFAQFNLKPNPKPLSVAQVRKLWRGADQRERLYIALGLNCAAYEAEIATFEGKHLYVAGDGNTYIAKRRGKTATATNAGCYKHLLWDVTKQLIELERQDHNGRGLLFRSRKGESLDRNQVIRQAFTKLRDRLDMDVCFSQLRDTMATMVDKIGDRTSNRELASMMLAHSDSRTARFYSDRKPQDIDSSALDEALREIEEKLQLTL